MDRRARDRFTELLKPVARAAQAYARHLAWHRNDVEDILQTALLNASRKFGDYAEGTSFKAWLLQFVTYAAFNANRRHEQIDAHELMADTEALDRLTAVEVLTHEVAYAELLQAPERVVGQLGQEVQEAVRALPAKRRSIFLLRAIGELSYREIADVLTVPVGTVMGELWRARKELREALCEYAQQRGRLREGGGTHVV
ncbi:MAG: hypothetical protein COV75_01270 [Candidatus Omnitrophica bacterium CG11_big_fil_rev_8_21_14_0_20_63_9]|nr:MAG: hypothetical protein COV75_01270 [Candidatus Omnitrophica bacterium CG11_big_fil_rev_8_21_14_0_20_63_9]